MYLVGCWTSDHETRGAMSGAAYLFADKGTGKWGSENYDSIHDVKRGRYRTPLPYGIATADRPASCASYGGRTYICGWATYNLVIDEHHRMWKQGMRGPEAPPTITGAPGSSAVGYLSWYDELTGERSPLSQGQEIGTAVPRTWTLPSRPPDDTFVSDGTVAGASPFTPDSEAAQTFYLRPGDRVGFPDVGAGVSYQLVDETGIEGTFTTDGTGPSPGAGSTVVALPASRATHCELWLSVAGGLPLLVLRVAIGTTTITESVATADLGESYIGAFERFPRCSMNAIWNDRQLMAGDPDNPDIVYMSDLFYPERYAGLNFRTRDGAPVTGILALRDYCLIFSRDRTYMLQGYTEADFSFSMLEQSLGSIGHRCNSVVHGAAYVWTEKGPYMFNGSWHPLSPDNLFVPETVIEDGPPTEKSRAVVDPEANTFMLVSDTVSLFDYYLGKQDSDVLVFDYTTVQPEVGGTFGVSRVSLDTQDVTRGADDGSFTDHLYYYLSNKWGIGDLYTFSRSEDLETHQDKGATSFHIFKHRRMSDTTYYVDDPGTTYLNHPAFEVLLGHYYFGEVGGSVMEGKTFKRFWLDARTYSSGSYLYIYPGDDDAYEVFATRILGGAQSVSWSGGFSFELPTHAPKPPTVDPETQYETEGAVGSVLKFTFDRMSGRGLTLRYYAPELGRGASFRGFGGAFIDGPATRYGIGLGIPT